jgi:nucleotide-binding universal stress UspA family protein
VDEQLDGRVIVGVAATIAGLQALRRAVDEARRRGVPLHAVRAWQFPSNWNGVDAARWRQETADEARAELREAFALAFGAVPTDVAVRPVIVEGAPHRVLVAQADRDSDLLVVGVHARRHPWLAMGFGQYCRRHAGCPVLLVPPPELARTGRTGALARRLRRETEEYVYAQNATELPGR